MDRMFESELRSEGWQPQVMSSVAAVQHLLSCERHPILVILLHGRSTSVEETLLTAKRGALRCVPILLVNPDVVQAEAIRNSPLQSAIMIISPLRIDALLERVRGIIAPSKTKIDP